MENDAVIVLDCGATNIRAIAVDRNGDILAARAFSNQTSPDPYFDGGLIWDTAQILDNISKACRQLIRDIGNIKIAGVCSTSFGVDGAPYDSEGNQLYPVISWACERTNSIMAEVHATIPLKELHLLTGLNKFHFNTLYKLYWLKKNKHEILDRADSWLFMPAIISAYLCGEAFTDVSMLGTSMLCDRKIRGLSNEVLSKFEIKDSWFPNLKEAGDRVGVVTVDASRHTNIPEGTPVYAAGHDTQFAIYGSGAGINQAVLSSGTWEVLMVRTPEVHISEKTLKAGVTTELDAIPGLYNPGLQWLGSKHIEEIRNTHFSELIHPENVYDRMVDEAREAVSRRGILFRKLLEEISEKTREGLRLLEDVCDFKAESLIVVGGGSKNSLWNEIREETLGLEIKTITQAETTVIGAARILFENFKA